jgi:hypothetical protein
MNRKLAMLALCFFTLVIVPSVKAQQTAHKKQPTVVVERVGDGTRLRIFRPKGFSFPAWDDSRQDKIMDPLSEAIFRGTDVALSEVGLIILSIDREWTQEMENAVLKIISGYLGTQVKAEIKNEVPYNPEIAKLFPNVQIKFEPTTGNGLEVHGETEAQAAAKGKAFRTLQQYLTVRDMEGKWTVTGRFFWSVGSTPFGEFSAGHFFHRRLGTLWLRVGLTTTPQPMFAGTYFGKWFGHDVTWIEDWKLQTDKATGTLFQKIFIQVKGPVWLRWEDFLAFLHKEAKESFSQLGPELRHGHWFVAFQWDFRQKGVVSHAGFRF